MRTAIRIRDTYRGRHQLAIFASFRPTWRQALSWGFLLGLAGAVLVVVAALVVPSLTEMGREPDAGVFPKIVWLVPIIPLSVGGLGGLVVGRQFGVRLDEEGIRALPLVPGTFAPWTMVVDVRAERRRRRTVVVVYLHDDRTLRLPAPYDGELLSRDPHFEHKLFMIRHVWETHRDWGRPVAAARCPTDAASVA